MKRMAAVCYASGVVLFGVFVALSEPSRAAKIEPARPVSTMPDCSRQADSTAGFFPRAYTLTSMYVRTKAPEYSLLKGQWVLGDPLGTLKAGVCLHIVKREEIGVIQLWYFVWYKDAAGQLRTGWLWGGTIGVDEGRYIGGDMEPIKQGAQIPEERSLLGASWLVSEAYAQMDTLPPPMIDSGENAPVAPPSSADLVYLVEVPVLGWTVSVVTISAIVLFVIMLSGMIAKAVWDQIDKDGTLRPTSEKIVRPLLVSPIAFSAFWGPMYVQQGGGGLSLTMALYAFQIGFMWQHVLEKKTAAG